MAQALPKSQLISYNQKNLSTMIVTAKFMITKEPVWSLKNSLYTDEQGCLNLQLENKLTEYRIFTNNLGQILLEPIANIPEPERWLWQNPEALNSVQRGLEQVAKGEVHYLGDFSQYQDLECED
ncbi:MAG TPA: hypothetical protein V6C58_07635 [Allocoleopsis sp.]